MISAPVVPFRVRGSDAWGSGDWRAPRGDRLHAGLDCVAAPGDPVYSPCSGVVRLGWCYRDDPRYRLVEITGDDLIVRVLYVEPMVEDGDEVDSIKRIGSVQDIATKYGQGMTNHIHLDVRLRQVAQLQGRGKPVADPRWINPRLVMRWR